MKNKAVRFVADLEAAQDYVKRYQASPKYERVVAVVPAEQVYRMAKALVAAVRVIRDLQKGV